jgi:hypothetical protein
MTKTNDRTTGAGTVLRGNFAPRAGNKPELAAPGREKSDAERRTEDFEKEARARIGGSIAFVTRLKDERQDVLLWDGNED